MIWVGAVGALASLLATSPLAEVPGRPSKAILSPKPLQQAKIDDLERRAALGEAQSAVKLGQLFEDGEEGVPKNPATAFSWFSRAAELGDLFGLEKMAWDLVNGAGTPINLKEGAKRFREAADRGSGYAMYNLGWMHERGIGTPKADGQAVVWYQKGAEAGHEEAMTALGWLMENGRGLPKDEAGAAQLYFRASEQGNAQAKCNLGWLFVEGRGVAMKSIPVALDLLTTAAEMGNARAMGNLGYLHENGIEISKNTEVAFSYFKRSAELGDAQSQAHLGWMLETGTGTPRDVGAASSWYERAGAQGDRDAALRVAWLNLTQDGKGLEKARGMEALRELVKLGFAPAFVHLANEFIAGTNVPKDPQEAERLLTQAVDLENYGAAHQLEEWYRNGTNLPKNPDREAYFAKKKRELVATWVSRGDPSAKAFQAELEIRESGGGREKDSLLELQRKAKAGDLGALFALGLAYQNRGAGLKADLKRAFDCFVKGAQAGFPPAKFQVGLYYEQGWGVPKNLRKALDWYHEARAEGNALASERIQVLEASGK